MAKAGRPKGRPRKLDIPVSVVDTGGEAKSSKTAEAREPVGNLGMKTPPKSLELDLELVQNTELKSAAKKERTAAKVEDGEILRLKK